MDFLAGDELPSVEEAIVNSILAIFVSTLVGSIAFASAPASTGIKQHGRFYVSGSPSEQELTRFKRKHKGAAILDLRAIDELGNCSEPAVASKLKMKYDRVIFEKQATIDPVVIENIDKSIARTKGKPVLLFCKTGNRAAAWLAIQMVRDEGRPLEEAIVVAREMGLKPDMEGAVREYLSASVRETAPRHAQSRNP
jgi:protein tyrosine phosphatase (PTP) superfamily phosphohydrolase (DUF442 family)